MAVTLHAGRASPGSSNISAVSVQLSLALVSVAAGATAAARPQYGLGLLALAALLALVIPAPVNVAVLAVPSIFLLRRLPVGSGISVSDAVLTIAALASWPAMASLPPSPLLRRARQCFGVYAATMAVVILAHPSGRAVLEGLHRTILVVGALSVGAWIAAEQRIRGALRLLVAGAVVLSGFAVAYTLRHGLQPAYALGYQKNALGSTLSLTLIVAIALPRQLALSRAVHGAAVFVIAAGVLASQSRGGMLCFAVGLLVLLMKRSDPGSRGHKGVLAVAALAVAIFAVFAVNTVMSELHDTTASATTNSIATRFQIEHEALTLFQQAPITGNGLRYFENPTFQVRSPLVQAPTNGLDEALAEGGIIEALGFASFVVSTLWFLARRRTALAVAGLAVVAGRFAHGTVDIFWLAGDSSLPFMIAGMGLWSEDHWLRELLRGRAGGAAVLAA